MTLVQRLLSPEEIDRTDMRCSKDWDAVASHRIRVSARTCAQTIRRIIVSG
jgi:hypothetical protein